MTTKFPFRVELRGEFYTIELYCLERGSPVYDLAKAATEAEEQYGDGWHGVYNGSESITREEWLISNPKD